MVLRLRLFRTLCFPVFFLLLATGAQAQGGGSSSAALRTLVDNLKNDPRGPYQAIRWFCPDGTVIPAKERCAEPGGIQHGLPKDAVAALAREEHLFLGQILAGTEFSDFLDRQHNYSRAKQYQLEKYLQEVDDGWIMRRGRYYRGALQAEDEEKWGSGFLLERLSDTEFLSEKFYLLRELVRDLPRRGLQADRWRRVRARAVSIEERLPAFRDLRVKLHGRPHREDIGRIEAFLRDHQPELGGDDLLLVEELLGELRSLYRTAGIAELEVFSKKLPAASQVLRLFSLLLAQHEEKAPPAVLCVTLAEIILQIRLDLPAAAKASERLALLDLSLAAEAVLFRQGADWMPVTPAAQYDRALVFARAAVGCGLIELWEWRELEKQMESLARLGEKERARAATGIFRSLVEWGSGMAAAEYGREVARFAGFEPLAGGFIDDRIRSSVLLVLGEAANALAAAVQQAEGRANQVLDLPDGASVQGINPGLALGTLRVVRDLSALSDWDESSIYVLPAPPHDLKPVAGLLTVDEGNLVSHVQLLARNLGIPNGSIGPGHLAGLLAHHGRQVFFAVSPGGRVVLKAAGDMDKDERAAIQREQQERRRLVVPTDRLDLGETSIVGLKNVRAAASGRICGPKAANLGELKHLFPEQVVEGLILPFGLFRAHLEQPMPGRAMSYWRFLEETFAAARSEQEVLERLAELRREIAVIPFLPGFVETLRSRFMNDLGKPLGGLPVFVRSDTNMEDLKDFTGAGLNLTVFNVVEEQKILQAIRDVWASPYAERSYRWRQKFLENPLQVYPSILILPSVPVDRSGVLITAGVTTGGLEDSTVAFGRGAGGAVEGQAAESWLLAASGEDLLLRPARALFHRTLPQTGGSGEGWATLAAPVADAQKRAALRKTAGAIRAKLPSAPGIGGAGPFDVELGFEGEKLWLFQARPYVENKRAAGSVYLRGLDAGGGSGAAPNREERP